MEPTPDLGTAAARACDPATSIASVRQVANRHRSEFDRIAGRHDGAVHAGADAMGRPPECIRGPIALPHHSAFTDWTDQIVDTMPKLPVDKTAAPFMNQITVLPLVSRQRMSLLP